MSQLYDVVATSLATGAQRIIERGVTEESAEACIRFAVMRRGVEEEFFGSIPADSINARISAGGER